MGIGWGGKTLRQMLEESERAFRETGRCYGIERLTLREEDPLKLERFQWRMISATIGARDTVKYACASPGTRELGELILLYHTPEGDCLAASQGLFSHIHILSLGVKELIRTDREATTGLKEGDIFGDCDPPMSGGAHPADVRTFTPVFWEGEVVGWASGIAHEVEVGGASPGAYPFGWEIYQDGYRYYMRRIGENDLLYDQDFLKQIERCCRMPVLWILDEKARASGLILIRERIKEIIQEFGIDYYKRAIREIAEEGRRAFLTKVRERLVPGRIRSAFFYPVLMKGQGNPYNDEDSMMHIHAELTIRDDGKLIWDFDGTSRRGWHPFNQYGGEDHVLVGHMIYQLMYDGRGNAGIIYGMEQNYPPGSVLNPVYPYASCSQCWSVHSGAGGILSHMISLGFYSRGYLEEVNTLAAYEHWSDIGGIGGSGLDEAPFGFSWFEFSATSSGASGVQDGVLGLAVHIPETDMADCEVWELPGAQAGLIYLGRLYTREDQGYGRYKGCNGYHTLVFFWNPPKVTVTTEPSAGGGRPIHPYGLYGGYPPPGPWSLLLKKTNIPELIKNKQPVPHSLTEVLDMIKEGRLKVGSIELRQGSTNSRRLEHGDLLIIQRAGGPGLGDPIDRQPEDVKNELAQGWITQKRAEAIYGVVASYSEETAEWSIDLKATEQKRREIREARKRRGIPTKEWWKKERQRFLHKDISDIMVKMYRECMAFSQKFANELIEFWQAPNDFTY